MKKLCEELKIIGGVLKDIWAYLLTVALVTYGIRYPLAQESYDVGQLGGWIGGIASAIAFLWLIEGYNLQRSVLSLQQAELKLQRKALEMQVKEMSEATKVSRETSQATLLAAQAAKKSADAAELNAKAAIGVEMPFLHIEDLTSRFAIEQWETNFYPELKIKNYGRTPAVINSINLYTRLGSLPVVPEYSKPDTLINSIVVEAGQSYEYRDYSIGSEYAAKQSELNEIQAKDGWLYVYGTIYYSDFMEIERIKGFCLMWVPANRNFIFASRPEYNYLKDSALT